MTSWTSQNLWNSMSLLCTKFIRSNWSNHFKTSMSNGRNSNDPRRHCSGARNDSGLFPLCTSVSCEVNLTPGRPAYEYINNGNVMTWKVMSNLTVFAFRMTLPRGKHRFYIYNISVEYIFILSKIFWLI